MDVGGPSFWEQDLARFERFVKQPPKKHALLTHMPSFAVIATVVSSLLVFLEGNRSM